jgi:hypothetical protein
LTIIQKQLGFGKTLLILASSTAMKPFLVLFTKSSDFYALSDPQRTPSTSIWQDRMALDERKFTGTGFNA